MPACPGDLPACPPKRQVCRSALHLHFAACHSPIWKAYNYLAILCIRERLHCRNTFDIIVELHKICELSPFIFLIALDILPRSIDMDISICRLIQFLTSPLETISTYLWASLYIIFQYCLFSVMSAVRSYLLIYSRLLSIHLRLGRPLLLFRYDHVHNLS